MKINARQLNLYAVTDRSWLKPGETLVSVTEELLKAGVTCVQLREKHMSDEEILTEASLLKDLCDRYQVPLIINDRPDLAKKSGASGVHVGLSDMGIQNQCITASHRNPESDLSGRKDSCRGDRRCKQ